MSQLPGKHEIFGHSHVEESAEILDSSYGQTAYRLEFAAHCDKGDIEGYPASYLSDTAAYLDSVLVSKQKRCRNSNCGSIFMKCGAREPSSRPYYFAFSHRRRGHDDTEEYFGVVHNAVEVFRARPSASKGTSSAA